MTTQVFRTKNFSHLGYWIEEEFDDYDEQPMGVSVYASIDPWVHPDPIRTFGSAEEAIRWIEMGRG